MGYTTITHNDFYAGISPYEKKGKANIDRKAYARFIRNINIHEDPSYMTPQPALSKISSTTVVDLVKWMDECSPWSTDKYTVDASGNIYKIDSSDTVTVDRSGATIGNGTKGQGLLTYNNNLYYATSTTIGRKGYLDGTPTYNDDLFSDGTTNVDSGLDNTTATGQVYTLATSIAETATHKLLYLPIRDPLKAILLKVAAKGTGDWTVTMHDVSNTVVGTVTIAAASMANGNVTFTFATPIRVIIGNDYHFHITSTVADGTLTTSVASDVSTAYAQALFGILIADTQWHPIGISPIGSMLIGNEHYVALWDEANYLPNKLRLDFGFKVRGFSRWNEFTVISAWKGTALDKVTEGKLYFWDGIASSYNFCDNVSLGLPNATHNSKNRIFSILGHRGMICLYNEPFKKEQEVAPFLGKDKKIEVYPGAVTEYLYKTYIGVAGTTDDTTIRQGVYEWGNLGDDLPEALVMSHTISTGTYQGTGMSIGCVKSFGKDMYVSWKDGANYGIDKTTITSGAATSGSYEQMLYDSGTPQKDMLPIKLVVVFLPLATGETITPKVRLNRGSWQYGTATTSASNDNTRAEFLIDTEGRSNEMEYGFDFTTAGTYFKVTGVLLEVDDNTKETPEGGI